LKDAGGDPAWEQFETNPSAAAQTSGLSFFENLERETAELEGKGKQRASPEEVDHAASNGYNYDAFEPAWTASSITSQISTLPPPSAEQDGHAVISLLSDPSFNPLSSISDADDLAAAADQPNPYIPTPTSSNQQGNETISLLSLVPGIDYYLSTSTAPSTTTTSTTEIEEPSQRVAIVRTTPTSISISISSLATTDRPWASAENLYHDVVYGNLREEPVDWDHDPAAEPLREMVAEHVRECEEKGAPLNDPVALRRLQMLLRHVGERKDGDPAAM
jgi:hypothetical protein